MIEFDHHSGVFLTNELPAKFHIHTIVRTPNGNDYGMDLLRMHYAEDHLVGAQPGVQSDAAGHKTEHQHRAIEKQQHGIKPQQKRHTHHGHSHPDYDGHSHDHAHGDHHHG